MDSRLTAPVGGGNSDDVPAVARLFLRLGFTAFGGPAAHVALMESEVVTRRGWLTRAAFLDQQALVQVLPGPNSTELAIHIGHARAGWRGAIVAGLCFILPSVVMIWLLAAVAELPSLTAVTARVVWWVSPVVVVIIAEALWKFGRQAFARPGAAVVMPVAAVAACLVSSDLPVLVMGATAAIAFGVRGGGGAAGVAAGLATLLAPGSMGAQAVGVPVTMPGAAAILVYFLRAGVSVFGSGYVLLAYLQRELVEARGWLSMDALLQAAALAQITPGPLFSTATAAGYMIGGSMGAMAATVGIFAPAFASVAIGAPLRRLVARSTLSRRALDGVVIASVALLGRALVGFALPLNAWQWAVAAAAAVSLLVVRVQATLVLVAVVVIGLAGAVLHFPPS